MNPQTETDVSPSLSPVRRWFLVEVWNDIREQFKAIVGDAVLFISALGILEAVNLILVRMQIPTDKKHILESTHFWGIYAVLLILVIDLGIKIFLSIRRPE